MRATDIDIRPAGQTDPEAINRVVESVVMTQHLPDRVKRLSLPVYRYDNVDLVHLDIVLAVDSRLNIIGIAVWEQADTRESPAGSKELSLHGIYVALHIIGKKSAVNFSGLLKKPSANTDLMDCWPRHNRVQMVWTHLFTQWLPEPSCRTSP
jgi:hypothetical protein